MLLLKLAPKANVATRRNSYCALVCYLFRGKALARLLIFARGDLSLVSELTFISDVNNIMVSILECNFGSLMRMFASNSGS